MLGGRTGPGTIEPSAAKDRLVSKCEPDSEVRSDTGNVGISMRLGSVPPSLDPASAVIVIEIADSDILWMELRDVLLSELSVKINDRTKRSLSSYHGGACVLHADGTVKVLDEASTEERVKELLTQ